MTDEKKAIGLRVYGVTLLSVGFKHRADALQLPRETRIDDLKIEVAANIVVSEDAEGRELATMILKVGSAVVTPPPLYQFDVQMAVQVVPDPAAPNMSAVEFLARSGAATIFPFVRELIANLTMRGRFGPLFPCSDQRQGDESSVAQAARGGAPAGERAR
ncbi:MAG: protein-export chaperone SecB [Gemmatimonadetes bacterium]|nr:protein-export chaperone SecB [Gemmatimonadota bacterium]